MHGDKGKGKSEDQHLIRPFQILRDQRKKQFFTRTVCPAGLV